MFLLKMSFIIDQTFSPKPLNCISAQKQKQKSSSTQVENGNSLKQTFEVWLQEFLIKNFIQTKTIRYSKQRIIKLFQVSFTNKICAVYSFKVADSVSKSKLVIDLVTDDNSFYSILNRDRCIQINKQVQNYIFQCKTNLIKIFVNFNNGKFSISLSLPLLFGQHYDPQENFQPNKPLFAQNFKLLMAEVGSAITYICKILDNDSISSLKGDLESTRINVLNKYLQLLTFKKQFSSSYVQIPQQKLKQSQKQEFDSLQRIKNHFIQFQQANFKSISLYCNGLDKRLQLDLTKPLFSSQEEEYFSQKIDSKCENKNRDNIANVVQPSIRIKEPEKIRFQPFRQFTNILLADIQFWFICSGSLGLDGNLQNYDQRNLVRKRVLVKKQTTTVRGNYSVKCHKHQKQIIKMMKNSHSQLINRYYQPLNSPNVFKNYLLMQFLPFPTLTEYTILNKHSISLSTKIHFIYFIVQSLRSLSSYNITHMDLKPNNILTFYFNFIRLIDFGESYHPQICDESYKPGFTQPYCAPQLLRGHQEFTIKYDIFSLGVIMSELLFHRYPFYFFNDAKLLKYKSNEFLSYWYSCPQGSQSSGEYKILSVFHNIINRCLECEPERRPQLNILAIIMQTSLQILF